MAQFDVHRNASRSTAGDIPFLLDVQSDALADATRRVVIPLARGDRIHARSEILNPEFEIEGLLCVAMPLDMASIPTSALGDVAANLGDHGDRIIRLIDQLVARF